MYNHTEKIFRGNLYGTTKQAPSYVCIPRTDTVLNGVMHTSPSVRTQSPQCVLNPRREVMLCNITPGWSRSKHCICENRVPHSSVPCLCACSCVCYNLLIHRPLFMIYNFDFHLERMERILCICLNTYAMYMCALRWSYSLIRIPKRQVSIINY